MGDTKIVFYESKERPVSRFCSDTLVYEECLHNGRYVGMYWSATGQVQRENIVDKLPGKPSIFEKAYDPIVFPIDSFKLEVDGQSLQNQWEWVESKKRLGEREGTEEAVVVLKHKIRPVSLNVVTRLDGSKLLVRYLEITNTGNLPAALSNISVFSGLLWDNSFAEKEGLSIPFDKDKKSMYSVGLLKSTAWGQEGNFVWQSLNEGILRIERNGFDKFSSPYYIIKNEMTGEIFYVGLAWSGNYFAEFKFSYPGNSFNGNQNGCLSMNIGPSGPSPLRVIAPGETVTSPKVHIGPIHCSVDIAVDNWYHHLRKSVIPRRPIDKEMYTVAGRVIEEPGNWILKEIDIAHEMGVEAFMVDAGWYGREFGAWPDLRGDWYEGAFLPEGGINAIREYTHKRGMLFGLWMEPESMGHKSELLSNHPDWKLVNNISNPNEFHRLVDLSNPEAAKYVEDSIIRVMKDFKLDFFKTDFNQRLSEGGISLREGFAECEEWRHYEILYKIYERARKEIPSLALENCAAGGGRNDLGMLSNFHYACESDYSMMPYSIRAINTMTLFIPPESICYYHNHMTEAHLTVDIDTHLRVTLFAQPIFVGFGAQNTERSGIFAEKTKKYIELGKGFCRSVMTSLPIVYHHTPFIGLLKPEEWCVLEYATPQRTSGYAGIFKLGSDESEYIFKPRGINKALNYTVSMDNDGNSFTMTGRELSTYGISIRLDACNTSELIMYSVAP